MNRTKENPTSKLAQGKKLPETNNEHTYMFIQTWQSKIQHQFSWKQTIERESSKKSYEHQLSFPDFLLKT